MIVVDLASSMIVKEHLTRATLDHPDTMIVTLPKQEPFDVSANSGLGSPFLYEWKTIDCGMHQRGAV